nr:amidohydrolase [Cryptococcus depauperatus CBS 7841]
MDDKYEKSRELRSSVKASGAQPYQRHPPRRTSLQSLHLCITVFIVAAIIIYVQKQSKAVGASDQKAYVAEGESLPERYAICSNKGQKVYTVPYNVEATEYKAWEEAAVGSVECVMVRHGEVIDNGSLNKIRRKWIKNQYEMRHGESTRIFWIPEGHIVTPGFIDSHGHPLGYGSSQQLILRGCRSIQGVVKRTEDFVIQNPPQQGKWIEGQGWDQNLWEPKEFPTAEAFEKSDILRGLPISLARVDFHVQWVSSAILNQLGDLPDVDGGEVIRDSSGKPTGIFIDNARKLLSEIQPPWTDLDRERFLKIMARDALSKGLTGVHDAQGFESDQPFWKSRMADHGKLPIRFYNMLSCEDKDYCGDEIPLYDDFDGHYTLRSVKLFADGALGSRGAALIDDYSDKPGWRGLMLKKEETWKPLVKQWHQAGWQVNIHAIGDRAAKIVLDAIESSASNTTVLHEARFRLEHAQVMRLEDIKRAAEMKVIASMQPTHATSDMWYAEDRLGPERIKGAYAWRSHLSHGGHMALGSDFPVESIDPLEGFYAAVTRKDRVGNSPHGKKGWYIQEKLTRVEALRGMTVWGAYASFSEDRVGSLTPGKKFDAVLWNGDLLSVLDDEILNVEVKAVIVDGKLVYGSLY